MEGGVDRTGRHIDRYHSTSSDRHTNMRTSSPPISRHHWQHFCTTPRGITGRKSGTAAIYTRNSTSPAPTGKSENNRTILQEGAPEAPAARVGVPLRTHPTWPDIQTLPRKRKRPEKSRTVNNHNWNDTVQSSPAPARDMEAPIITQEATAQLQQIHRWLDESTVEEIQESCQPQQ
jgi:hypothetical protein